MPQDAEDKVLYGLLIGAGLDEWADVRASVDDAFKNDYPVSFDYQEDFEGALDAIPRRRELQFVVVTNELDLSRFKMEGYCRSLEEISADRQEKLWVVFVDEDLYHLARVFTSSNVEIAYGLDDLALRAPWTRGMHIA